jgi:hypothetical protein
VERIYGMPVVDMDDIEWWVIVMGKEVEDLFRKVLAIGKDMRPAGITIMEPDIVYFSVLALAPGKKVDLMGPCQTLR